MKKPQSPAFQFYPDDFLGSPSVAVMTPTEIGVYVLLLCMDWNGNGISYNPKLLARYCRMSEAEFVEAWAVVGPCFVERDGKWYNPRLERERDKQAKFSARQSAAAAMRWQSHGNATAMPTQCSPIPFPALATTGGRKRLFNNEPPAANAPWCIECQGVVVQQANGKPRKVHTPECSRGNA